MRTFLALICSLALACTAGGAQEENNSKKPAPKKNQAQRSPSGGTGMDKPTITGKPTGKPAAGAGNERELMDKLGTAHRNNSRAGMGKATTVSKPNSFAKPTPSPHGYVGRNDGKVQQSTAYGKPGPVLNPIIFDPNGVPAGKPTGAGKATEAGKPTARRGSSKPMQDSEAVIRNTKPSQASRAIQTPINMQVGASSDLTLQSPSGVSQGKEKPAGGKKKSEKVSPTPRSR
jgi:hypothetical protein